MEIKIEYLQGYCFCSEYQDANTEDYYCEYCYTECAEDLGCDHYRKPRIKNKDESTGKMWAEIPVKCKCEHAACLLKYKGFTAKNYEAYVDEDPFKPRNDVMVLIVGKRRYNCRKVVIDGEQIFPEIKEQDNGQSRAPKAGET